MSLVQVAENTYDVYIYGDHSRYTFQAYHAEDAFAAAYDFLSSSVLEMSCRGSVASEVFRALGTTLKVVNSEDPTDTYAEDLFK